MRLVKKYTRSRFQVVVLLLVVFMNLGFVSAESETGNKNIKDFERLNQGVENLRGELTRLRNQTDDSTKTLVRQNQKLIDVTNSLVEQVNIDRKIFLKESNSAFNLNEILPSIVGAVIGGLLAIASALFTLGRQHKNNQKKAKEEEAKAIDSLLKAIYSEVDGLWEAYKKGVEFWEGRKKWKEGEPIFGRLPLEGDYFTVYNNTAHLVGRIEDDILRNDIIRCYIQAKGLIDTWKMNNLLNEKYVDQELVAGVEGGKANKQRLSGIKEFLVIYAKTVIQYHKQTEIRVNDLLRSLEILYPDLKKSASTDESQ